MGDFLWAQNLLSRNLEQIRNNRIEDEQLKLRNAQQQEAQNLNRLNTVMNILKLGGTPVNPNGTTTQMLSPQQTQMAGNAGIIGLDRLFQPADPARTFRVGDNSYMLPTADEMTERGMRERQQLNNLELENFKARQSIDDASALDRSKKLFDYTQSQKAEIERQRPQFDPRNPLANPVPMDNLGGFASTLNLLFPEFKALNNYETNETTMARANRVTGQVESQRVPNAVAARPRAAAAPASGGRARTRTEDPAKREEKFRRIEESKLAKLRAAEMEFQASGDPAKLDAAKRKAQADYEQEIIKAGGSVAPRGQAANNTGGVVQVTRDASGKLVIR